MNSIVLVLVIIMTLRLFRWFGSEFHIFSATNENDLEVAMEVFCRGAHIDKDEEDRSDRTGAYRGMSRYSEVGGLLKL